MSKNFKAALVVIASSLVGCASFGEDAETTNTSADPVTQSIPTPEWFAIDLDARTKPGPATVTTKSTKPLTTPSAATCNAAAPAEFAALSHKIASEANGVVGHITGLVAQITSHPPTEKTDGHAAWGPITDAASPAVYRFDVHRAAPNVYAFRLAGRPKTGDDSTWRGILEGTVAPIDATHRAGDARVDFAAAHAVNPASEPSEGGLGLHFQATDDVRLIEITFGGVKSTGEATANDAVYRYAQPKDGVGTFDFVTRTDFDKDGKQDELVRVQSRWDGAAGGQAIVTILDGSLPKPVVATECWNATGGAVFYADDGAIRPPGGAQECCPK